jgi:hypothetical protein
MPKSWKYVIYIVSFACILLEPIRADAYIDPNTGGFFFTSVLPFVYGILAAVVLFGKRIVSGLKNIFSKNKNSSDE